jgi:integrase
MGFKAQRDIDRLKLPPGKSELVEFDETCPGLGVRLQGSAKVFLVRYQLPTGQRRKLTLGPVSGMTLADARKAAVRITSGAKDGHDPQQEREARKRQAADTLGALVELYLDRYARREQKPRTLVETTRALRKHLEPLHRRPLADITRRDVAARLQELVESSGPIMANRTRAALSHCFAWAMQQGLAEANPVVGTARPAPEVKRERVLSLDELRTVWVAAGDDDYGRIVKALILTGQRREEIGGMAEAELDRDAALWVLPAARSKNGRAHEVPLAPLALESVGPARPGRSHVFGRGRAGFSGWSQSKARLDQRIVDAGAALEPWTLHDIRRSLVTHMNEHGLAQPHVIEAITNHLGGIGKASVAGTYNRAIYREEKRRALVAWAAFVADLVAGREAPTNVVELARAGR